MRVVGIIAEYNPFHQGHAYQLRAVREKMLQLYGEKDAAVVAVISGSFTQRGGAAVLDKWQRAQMAVLGGCSLVLELPFLFACRSAQDFARGGVRLLSLLGIVDTLAFGAESSELLPLAAAARTIDAEATQAELHERLQQGESYAKALTAILQQNGLDENVLRQPNNILAIEYLRALGAYAPDITPLLIARRGAGYHETALGPLASASAVRQELKKDEPDWPALRSSLPETSFALLQRAFPADLANAEHLFRPLLTKILTMDSENLRQIFGLQEGLENRLLAKACESASLEGLTQAMVTSRYPASRIARIFPHLLLGSRIEDVKRADETGPLYARVLAFDETGRRLLHAVKKTSAVPLITKVSQFLDSKQRLQDKGLSPLQKMLAFDTRATELRLLSLPEPFPLQQQPNDFIASPLFCRRPLPAEH
ncbi:tRNA(Met) cytidine acetate ligase [Mitsuokella sp.]|uniref:tRNA(Met) cytidine acetate ligase n=1 Tax=unclassified Mitsuokella TaxID=2637239 RepID=UPI003D7E39FF